VPDALEPTVGDVHELELRGLGSAGYSWHVDVEGPEGVVAVRRAPSGPAPSAEPGGPPPPSGSLPERIELAALAPGHVRVRAALRRSWEDGPPLEERELDVAVR
jgi:hypothetical protein